MNDSQKPRNKSTRVKKLSGEETFFNTLDWAKHYVAYKNGKLALAEVNEQKILAYAMHLNDITENGKVEL